VGPGASIADIQRILDNAVGSGGGFTAQRRCEGRLSVDHAIVEKEHFMTIEIFHVPGIRTQQDAEAITQAVKRVTGTRTVQINLAQCAVRVEHDNQADVSEIIRAIKRVGFADVAVMA
jgi:copper chaperone CopZ